ncbi:MAG: DNA primase [Candidatus Marinimicrobia bacterium]|nr:DNA primase [Candidatus Neomarinimicrobiota bacterium]
MARIPEETIERIRDAADILDVVSDYVQLKRRGRNWFGLCPFHQEKTPSFSINQQKQIYHCFGCGRGGGAFNFVMEVDKLDFLEAVQRLGDKVGIPVELSGSTDPRRKATVQQVLDLCELAAAAYRKNLQGNAGAKVRAYLEDRGITPAAQALFRIGYALPGWHNLPKAIGAIKFSREALDQSGLFASGQRGTYDRFRSRIMFPISIPTGRVVALAGRVFDSDDTAKYINSPETPVYHKSEVLYGLSLTRNPIRDQETAIIVEGYLDLIQLHQAGIQNVVAVSGTALTDRHARELRKLTTRIFLAYDGDNAGIQAAIRGGYTLLRNGLSPRVVLLPEDQDPDDWVREAGPKPFLKAVDDAMPLLEFHLQHFGGDPAQPGDLRRFLDETLRELVQVPDPLVQELNLKQVAELTGIDERRLHKALGALPKFKPRNQKDSGQENRLVIVEDTRSHRAQMALVGLAFQDSEPVLNLLADQAQMELFTHPVLTAIWQVISPALQNGNIPDPAGIMDQFSTDEQRQVLSQILMKVVEEGDPMSLAIDCLTALHRDTLQQQIDQRRRDLRLAEGGSGQPPSNLITEVATLQRDLANLGQQFQKYRIA